MPSGRALFSVLVVWTGGLALAAPSATPPGLDPAGLKAWAQYQKEATHRAFAIAPGGQWGWRSGLTDTDQATEEALAACQENGAICLAYDLNGRRLLSATGWERAFAPYPGASTQVGTRRGQRFPDLRLQTSDGKPVSLVQPEIRITILHFWGSWCPPCVRELPNLAQTQKRLAKEPEIRFILVPLREPMATSQAWLQSHQLNLSLTSTETAPSNALKLTDGKTLSDRQMAPVFPTTYILDGNGTVLFSRHGPIHDWASLIPILRHAARNSAVDSPSRP